MEARWIYREVEEAFFAGRALPAEFPHSLVSRALRYRVAEARDAMLLMGMDFLGKAAWYRNSQGSSGTDRVNDSRKAMFSAIPYIGRGAGRREKQQEEEERPDGRAAAEQLMYRFMAEKEAEKKAAAEAAKGAG